MNICKPTLPSSAQPLAWASAAQQYWLMLAEAQMVMGMRMAGMAMMWSIPRSEYRRMVVEKQEGYSAAAHAATRAILSGQPPEKVAKAAVRPIRARTRSNYRRLAKRGPA
ncbi:hypothetical protein [Poseidonocella sedimentorum]|uniref:Antifreeze protein n=1 Tax=Poseidonocella sedimentorum TaxID=871652 RepID=A0A1I6CN62_9RHOB|nr:hypothetical protein [Poseidonocella sedimentorum]SFQ94581.1 hypothetical protein SAMN04515673_10154 [Poseidonocella sedimentorum]